MRGVDGVSGWLWDGKGVSCGGQWIHGKGEKNCEKTSFEVMKLVNRYEEIYELCSP